MPRNVHLVGIGGTGMSTLASILLEQGKNVSGSDIKDSRLLGDLIKMGAKVYIGHRKEQVNGAEMVIVSTAIEGNNPEIEQAKALNIPIKHRSEVWAHLLNSQKGIAVAGAHGKTTTASMIAWILYNSGLDPTYLIGGEIVGLGGGHFGHGKYVVAEADESDGSFLRYSPWCSILTSIEPDHLEFYNGDFNELYKAYRQFIFNTKEDGLAILCIDSPNVRRMIKDLNSKVITYGFSDESEYQAEEVQLSGIGSTFTVHHLGEALGKIQLQIPGRHNVQNALAAISACIEVGMDFPTIASHLHSFKGSRRRFEIVSNHKGIIVVDDYAHHPSEIEATLMAAKSVKDIKRIVVVFQPHRYSRTQQLMDEFATAFSSADYLLLTDVYSPPPEKPIPGISSQVLHEKVKQALPSLSSEYVGCIHNALERLREIVRFGDMVITMGAGDISQVAWNYANLLRENLT